MTEKLELRPDGPHTDAYTLQVARALPESVRVLNHATLSGPGLSEPGTVYGVVGALTAAARGLDQLLAQTFGFLEAEHAAGRLEHDTGDMAAAARDLPAVFAVAVERADALADALAKAHSFTSHLYAPGPDNVGECWSELIDGSWTYCGCVACRVREADDAERDAEYGITDPGSGHVVSRRGSARFMDPAGDRYGIPTYSWRMAPEHLLTMRQLAARRLRPGGSPVVAQVLWRSRRYNAPGGVRAAYLYDVRAAKPKRTPTDRQRAALAKAMTARRTCPDCGRDAGYVIPRRYGVCVDCMEMEVAA